MQSRALVAAMLRPHHREDPKFGDARLPPERRDDAIVFVGRETVTLEQGAVDRTHDAAVETAPCAATCETTESKRTRPSALPRTDSHARSGCGINPTTFRSALQMPAIPFTA